MLGAIIGDIIGSRWEFNKTSDYNFEIFSDKNSFTDDTICTVAIADAILKGRDYGDSLHDWCRRYMKPTGGFGGRFRKWVESDDPQPYYSYGNGSAMRVSPVGMWYSFSSERTGIEARCSAVCTHNHPEGIKGAECIARAIQLAISLCDGVKDPDTLQKNAMNIRTEMLINHGYDYDTNYSLYRNDFDETCQGTVPPALDIIGRSNSFEDAIRKAVSLGADADTLGAIVGSIAEHIWGIPCWIKERALTYLTDEMRQVVERFYNALDANEDYKPKEKELERMKNLKYLKEHDRIMISSSSMPYMKCDVAGTHFIKDKIVFKELEENDIVRLEHEEDNKFDENAVAIYFKDQKIGYVPRKQNKDLSLLLKTGWGKTLFAYVCGCEGYPENKKVSIEIMMKRCYEDIPNNHSPFDFDESTFKSYKVAENAQLYYSIGGRTGLLPGRTTPKRIDSLKSGEIFVFGSNQFGHHIGGAAKAATTRFGAKWGQGDGLQGQSYAISTMEGLVNTARNVNRFIDFAAEHQELRFYVTPIGCGIAGYNPLQIAPLFAKAIMLPNVYLPRIFWEYFWQTGEYHPDYFEPDRDWAKWDKF